MVGGCFTFYTSSEPCFGGQVKHVCIPGLFNGCGYCTTLTTLDKSSGRLALARATVHFGACLVEANFGCRQTGSRIVLVYAGATLQARIGWLNLATAGAKMNFLLVVWW